MVDVIFKTQITFQRTTKVVKRTCLHLISFNIEFTDEINVHSPGASVRCGLLECHHTA